MALKLGMRVTVKAGVSNCTDETSVFQSTRMARGLGLPVDHPIAKGGISREHFVGMKGEVVQIGQEVLPIKVRVGTQGHIQTVAEAPATIPPGCEDCVLVDSQVVNSLREGQVTMREWFRESELEPG